MRLNSINKGVPAGAWGHAGAMVSAVLDGDQSAFDSALKVKTRWEDEALSSLAAAAVTELAGHTHETPDAIVARLVSTFAASR